MGSVLEAWYLLEQLRKDRNQAEQFERGLDDLNRQINKLTDERDQLEKWVCEQQPIVQATAIRQNTGQRLEMVQQKVDQLKSVARDWPIRDADRQRLEADLPVLEEKVDALTAERERAEKHEARRSRREMLDRAIPAAAELKEARNLLEGCRTITGEQLGELESLHAEIQELEAGLAAGRLRMMFRPTRRLELKVQSELEPSRRIELDVGSQEELQAGYRSSLSMRSGASGSSQAKSDSAACSGGTVRRENRSTGSSSSWGSTASNWPEPPAGNWPVRSRMSLTGD